MQITDISLWGVALMIVLMALAMGVFLLIDRREMMRVLKVFGLTLGQILVSGAGVWLVYKMNVWWMNLLWLVVMLTLSGGLCLYKIRGQLKKQALPIAAAMAVGCLVSGGSMMLALPGRCFVPVFGMLLGFLMVSVTLTLQTYQRCLLHTESHRQYLLAQLRTMAQPLLVAMPLLFAGMLLGGASPAASICVLLLIMVAAFVASVVAGVIAVSLYSKLSF